MKFEYYYRQFVLRKVRSVAAVKSLQIQLFRHNWVVYKRQQFSAFHAVSTMRKSLSVTRCGGVDVDEITVSYSQDKFD